MLQLVLQPLEQTQSLCKTIRWFLCTKLRSRSATQPNASALWFHHMRMQLVLSELADRYFTSFRCTSLILGVKGAQR